MQQFQNIKTQNYKTFFFFFFFCNDHLLGISEKKSIKVVYSTPDYSAKMASLSLFELSKT